MFSIVQGYKGGWLIREQIDGTWVTWTREFPTWSRAWDYLTKIKRMRREHDERVAAQD